MIGGSKVTNIYRGDGRRHRAGGTYARRACVSMPWSAARGRGLRYAALLLSSLRGVAVGGRDFDAGGHERPRVFRDRVVQRSTHTTPPDRSRNRRETRRSLT